MKFDPDVALAILRGIEEYPSDELPMKTNLLSELDEETYYFHCRLLSEAGFIAVYIVRTQRLNYYWPRQMSWPGVQFLQMFNDDSFWQKTKREAQDKGLGLSLDVLTNVGLKLVEQLISGG